LQLNELKKKQSLLGWLRLFTVIISIILAYRVFISAGAIAWIVVGVGIMIFLVLITFDANNNAKIANVRSLLQINEDEVAILDHQFEHRYSGIDFLPATHSYAGDLDVFGPFSLFQYINRCYTEQGKNLLAKNFLSPLTINEIYNRHDAIEELSPQFEWRQQLAALALEKPVTLYSQKRIESWLMQEEAFFSHPVWSILLPVYCLLTVGSAVAAILGFIPPGVFSFLFVIYLIISTILSRKPTAAYLKLSRVTGEVSGLQQLIGWIENKSFSSLLFTSVQSTMSTNGKAGQQIKNLKEILNRFDLRLNVFVFIFLNSFLLWDVWQMRSLNKWKERNKKLVPHWFDGIAIFETLNSLATLHFNQPEWCLPQFSNEYFLFEAKELGHPLIKKEPRVNSDFQLAGKGKLALITGSNMAGKSTFLRSLGVNTILANMGAAVCAKELALSSVQLICSMRIADNLAENTSTFYAELKKLQTVIEAVKRHEPVFILLDEILRGTNSLDRHIGSKALIKQLIKKDTIAVIATHDIELTKLSAEFSDAIDNYHFDVQVAAGDELFFDYKLKEGVCTSLNATILMKKIGIELG
jgi:ABC-type polar amino acid transport system ATPase subunit